MKRERYGLNAFPFFPPSLPPSLPPSPAQGEQLTSVETTTVFFGVTKLFQSHNSNLRRMMYLFIKEMAEACNPDDVIIVTSSLTKVLSAKQEGRSQGGGSVEGK